MPQSVTLHGARLTLRPVEPGDLDALLAIVAEPAVMRWWGTDDPKHQSDEFAAGYAIVVEDVVVGWLGVSEENEPQYRHAGLDITLTTALHDQGYGPEALRLAIGHLIDQGHHRFTIDPAASNARAIRAYAKVGFKPIGVMRSYERAPDGAWRDGLLMDLLADELVD